MLKAVMAGAQTVWFRLAVSTVGVFLLIHALNFAAIGHTLSHLKPLWFIFAVALTGITVLASAAEWGVLVRSHTKVIRRLHCLTWYVEALFAAQVLPAAIGGDAMRAVSLSAKTSKSHALASLAGARLSGALGMALWALVGAIFLASWLGNILFAGAGLFLFIAICLTLAALFSDRIVPHLVNHGPASFRTKIAGLLTPFAGALANLRRRPHALIQSLSFGTLGWGLNLSALTFFARALDIDVAWTIFAVAVPIGLLIALAPISFNGIGLREGVLVGLLTHAGVSLGAAGAIALLVDLQMLPFAFLGGLLWLSRRRHSKANRLTLIPAPVALDHLATTAALSRL